MHVEIPLSPGGREPPRDGGSRDRFDSPVGLSDHTPDIYTSLGAIALGAVVIEKHFTLSRRLYGPGPPRIARAGRPAALVEGARQVEAALGTAEKLRDPDLDPARATFEKSVVTTVAVGEGALIEPSMLTTKRPGNGIPAVRLRELVGRRTARALEANHLLEEADVV